MATSNTIEWTNSAATPAYCVVDEQSKEKDPFAMKGWSYMSVAKENLPRNVLGQVSDLMPTNNKNDPNAAINRRSWKTNLEAIDREYARAGSIGRHDLVCLIDFVHEANHLIELAKSGDGIQEVTSHADRVEDLEREVQHKNEVIDTFTIEVNAIKKRLDKAAEFAAYAHHLEQDEYTAMTISDWLIDNGYNYLVPGTDAYDRRMQDHAANVAELQEARDRIQVAESMNHQQVSLEQEILSHENKIINQIKEEEDEMGEIDQKDIPF